MRLRTTTSKEIEWVKLFVDNIERETFNPEKLITTSITVDAEKPYVLRGVVRTKDGQEKDTTIRIGVGVEWNASPSPSPSISPTPTPTP